MSLLSPFCCKTETTNLWTFLLEKVALVTKKDRTAFEDLTRIASLANSSLGEIAARVREFGIAFHFYWMKVFAEKSIILTIIMAFATNTRDSSRSKLVPPSQILVKIFFPWIKKQMNKSDHSNKVHFNLEVALNQTPQWKTAVGCNWNYVVFLTLRFLSI